MEKIKKSNSIKKILVLTLVFVMALTMMPAMAWAAEGAVSVTFTYSKDNTIVYGPMVLDVKAGQASAYGIGEASSQPTVLDAVVAAHITRYGDNFTKKNSGDYLNKSLSKIFGDSGYAGHMLDSHYSSDLAAQAVLNNGDNVDTFLYSSSWEDLYAAFYQDEQIVKEVETVAGEELSLKVKGFGIMSAYEGEVWNSLPDVNVRVVDLQGVPKDTQSVTDESGNVSVSFDKEGTYFLTTSGTSGSTPIVPAWCKVIVQKGLPEEEQQAAVSSDKENLNIQYISGNFIDLPKRGASEKTKITWSSDRPEVISASGNVVKQLEDTKVTLTANIICGNVQDTKVFPITVPAMNETDIEERIASAKAELKKVDIMNPVQYSGGSGGMYSFESEVQDTNIKEKAQTIVSKAAPGVIVSLKSVDSGQDYIAADGTITYPSGYSKGNASVTFNLKLGNKTDTASVAGIVIPTYDTSKAEAVKAELDKLTLEQVLNGQEQSNVTSTMKLPVGSSFGLGITWNSDNSAITINRGTSSSTGQLHTVTRPAYGQKDATVTLTATIDYSDMAKQHGMCDGGPMPSDNTKSFTVTVPAITAAEADNIKKEVEEAVDSVIAAGITAYEPGTDNDTKVAADLEKIVYDLHLYDFDRTSDFWKDGVRLSWSSTNPAITVNNLRAKVSRPSGKTDAKGKLIVTAGKEGITASKAFDTVVLATGVQPEVDPAVNEAIKNITDGYAAKSAEWWGSSNATWWVASAVGADNKYSNTEKLNKAQKQAYANQMIDQVALALESIGSANSSEAKTANQLANAINGLSAMGYDVEKITTINSTSIKAGSSLQKINLDGAKKGFFSTIAPYVMLAANQCNDGTDKVSDGLIDYLLSIQLESGGWGYGTTTDIDTTAMVMQGLAASSNSGALAACEQGLEVLASKFAECEGNTFGNANTDAMAIIALAEMGVNPDADARFVKNGKSLVDGLVSYLNESKTAFMYNGRENDMATSQGVLGLIAAKAVAEKAAPVNVFDFSDMTKDAVKATGVRPGESQEPPSQGEDLTVTVSIQSNTGYWLNKKSVTVKKGSNVGNVLIKAIEGTDIRQIGAANGYVSSISKGDVTLSEFTLGPNSGWLYKVNGILPNISIASYEVTNGDSVLFYYTTDWTKDPDASKYPGAPTDQSSVTTSGTAGSATTTTPTEVTVSGDTAKATIKTENTSEAIKQAKEKKSAEIVIEVASGDIKTAEKVQVELPTATAKEILNTTTADLTVKTPIGTVTVPQDALKEAVAEAKGTTITVEVAAVSKPTDIQKKAAGTNGQIISVTIKSGSTVISTFGGKSLKLKAEVPAKLMGKKIVAIHIAADGTVEKMQGELIKEGTKEYYEFSTPHLSTFALVDADEIGLEEKDEEANVERIKELVSDMSLKASSSKTSKKNIKVALTVHKDTAAAIKEIEDMGYTVKYKYYRSTRKASKYASKLTSKKTSYTNTAGKKGTKYYYKARVQVYDKDGKLVAQTALKQCRYAARTWSK